MLSAPNPPDRSFLEVGVRGYSPPKKGSVEAVVTLQHGGARKEIGRFSIFPNEPFVADDAGKERTFQLSAGAALEGVAAGDLISVKVELVPEDPTVEATEAKLVLGRVKFRGRR